MDTAVAIVVRKVFGFLRQHAKPALLHGSAGGQKQTGLRLKFNRLMVENQPFNG
jgi:hypothetical protein